MIETELGVNLKIWNERR